MAESPILLADDGAVRTLTLNRPAALNSANAGLLAGLLAALEAAAAEPAVRCVVVTGAGRAFCAGQDLAAPEAAPGQDLGAVIAGHYRPMLLRLRTMPVPVVAAVNGVAAGAGANLALGCDLVIAARSASFLQAFTKVGLLPDCGGTFLLPRLVGRARALGLALLGDKLSASDAESIGLIWRCVDDAAFAGEVKGIAQRLAAMPTRALVATREAIDAAQHLDYAATLDAEAGRQRDLGFAPDYLEGVAAFAEKRAPRFRGR